MIEWIKQIFCQHEWEVAGEYVDWFTKKPVNMKKYLCKKCLETKIVYF